MVFELMDGGMRDEPHFNGYVIRACRHGDTVTIYNLFPGSGYVFEHPEISYTQYLVDMQKHESLIRAYGKN